MSEDLAGLGPPLYEDQTLLEADITRGATLILEPGPVPLRSQVTIILHQRKGVKFNKKLEKLTIVQVAEWQPRPHASHSQFFMTSLFSACNTEALGVAWG